jgi:hypothetical protein
MSIKQNGGVFGRNPTFNDVTIEGDLIINGEVFTGLDFQGSWNASTNSPALASSVGTNGEFYIVSIAGGTNLNGITNWGIGDWAIFNGTAWQRVEGGADGNFNDVTVAGTLGVTGEITANGGIALGDNDKATFGASDDLQIYHDGANSFIYEGGTGSLKIQAVNLNLQSTTGESYIDAVNNGSVYIYYDNAQKLTTTATGIDVVGMATMDGLTVDGEIILDSATGNHLLKFYRSDSTINAGNALGQILFGGSDEGDFPDAASIQASAATSWGATSSATQLDFFTTRNTTVTPVKRLTVADSGDISFYEDTGTTAKLFWDASAESLGIGTSTPTSPLTVNRLSTDGTIASFEKDGATVGSIGTDTSRFKVKSNSLALYLENEGNKQLVWGNVSGVPYFYPQSDNDTNIGFPTQRFKDLYLSGGVYLGGTGAANHLDDYEEGTWTPVIADAATGGNVGSATTTEGFYTKVGQVVNVYMFVSNIVTTGMTAANLIYFRGLPFATASTNAGRSQGNVRADQVTFTGYLTAQTGTNVSHISLSNIVSGNTDIDTKVQDFASGGSDVFISLTYRAA